MIKRLVKLVFQEDQTEVFLRIFEESQPLILAFPGCRHVELLRCTAPANIFFTLSLWESEAALEKYRQSELFKSTWSRTKLLFADKPEAWSTKVFRG